MLVRRILPFLVSPSLLLIASPARASDPAAAEQLFEDARQLMAQGRYADACPKLEESQKEDPGIGTQFHLADCWARLGRTASAWALFCEVASEAHANGEDARARVARDRAEALAPFVPKMVIDAAAPSTPGMQIRRDGVDVPRDLWGASLPVDPGPHVVAATAPGKVSWQTSVQAGDQGAIVHVDVPPLVEVPAPPAAAVRAPAPSRTPPERLAGVTSMMPTSEQPVLENHGGAQRAFGWFFVGAGVVGLGAGGYFGVKWMNDYNTRNAHCVGTTCDSFGVAAKEDARTQSQYALVTGGAGVGALLLGAILVAAAPSPQIVTKAAIVPVVGPNGGGVALHAFW